MNFGFEGLSVRKQKEHASETWKKVGVKPGKKEVMSFQMYQGLQKDRKKWAAKREERRRESGMVTHHLAKKIYKNSNKQKKQKKG